MAQFDVKKHEELKARKIELRKFATLTHSAQTTLLEIILGSATRTDLFKTCITCHHFRVIEPIGAGNGEVIEVCKLVNKRPPAKIIADGCENYNLMVGKGYEDKRVFACDDDDIPF